MNALKLLKRTYQFASGSFVLLYCPLIVHIFHADSILDFGVILA